MKKVTVFFISISVCVAVFILMCVSSIYQEFGKVLGADFNDEGIEEGICGYTTSEDIVFDERTEEKREEFRKQLHPYYLNVAMAMYQIDGSLSVEEIVTEILTWDAYGDVGTNLQNFKYGHEYTAYLEMIQEEHSLSTSRKYFTDHYDRKDEEKDAYIYYLKVLGVMNEECKALASDGEYVTPLEQPFVITQDFGKNSIAGGTHFGVDIVQSYGAPVYAVTNAVVDKASNQCPSNTGYIGNMCNQGQGNFVQLSVIDDDQTIYITTMHMKSIDVKEGDVVTMGQKIGEQGNSGNSSGSHCHIEFRKVPYVSTKFSDFLDPHHYIDFYSDD